MKQFFGGCFGAFIGVLIGIIILAVVLFAAITKSVSDVIDSKSFRTEVNEDDENKSVLKINLTGEIIDYEKRDVWNFDIKTIFSDKTLVLPQMVRSIEVAAKDENIKGIYIRIYPFSASLTQLEELRKALQAFKKSGKWIYVYADNYFQGAYYLASMADKVILNPQGLVFWKGFASQIIFYKKALEKLDVQVQVFRHGKFKSAVEPFVLEKMSDENRQQMRLLIGSLWSNVLNNVSDSRKISVKQLDYLANELAIKDADAALNNKLVDLLADEKSTEEMIQKLVKKDEKTTFVDYHKYKSKSADKYNKGSSNKIAVVHLSGQIIDYVDNSGNDVIVPSRLLKIFKKIEKDDKTKAVVLRVNSPGGSAFASDVIWQAIKELKSVKPVIVSFGEVAASGGYYISCGADYIFTDYNTITGSIGVFGLLPNVQGLMQKKLGLNADTVKTSTYADLMSPLRPVQAKEYEWIMHNIEKVYDTFLSRVSEGRKLDKSYIDKIGEGRVWSGVEAVKLKLADEIGTLEDAIDYAAKKVGIKKYDIEEYPKAKDPFIQIFETFGADDEEVQEKILKNSLGKYYKDVLIFKQSLKNQQVNYLTLMPYQIHVY